MGLLDIQPHKVSRDLRGYSVMFYGGYKTGKTTIASKFPGSLIFAFEKGYSALSGVYAQPINSWSEFIKNCRELESEEVKARYETIVVDTADIAYDYCEEYICNVAGVDSINKIPYGQGFTKVAKEFDTRLRKIVQLGYGLVIISHAQDKTFQNEDGSEYNKIVPTLGTRPRLICSRMCDIIGYSRSIDTDEGVKTFLFMRGTPRFEAGSRFKYTPDKIEFTYKNLVDAIAAAIDKQAAEDGEEYITSERENVHLDTTSILDFDKLMDEFQKITSKMVAKDASYFAPRITEIAERYLGKGKKVSECTRDQAMLLDLIVNELHELN